MFGCPWQGSSLASTLFHFTRQQIMLDTTRLIGVLAISVAAIGLAPIARAQVTYDVAQDFSLASNPNGPWTYGYSTTLNGALVVNANNFTANGIEFWNTNISSLDPASFYNPTRSVITIPGLQLQPGQFGFHPGPNNEYEKARLTLSSSGVYSIDGTFAGAATNGTSTDVHILLNGVSIFDGAVNGFGAGTGPGFALTRSLSAGDTLDFAVGYGSNKNFFSDTTALDARVTSVVTAVPEPNTLFMLGMGALLLVPWTRKHAKRL
jgi:PEP-CTERM motif